MIKDIHKLKFFYPLLRDVVYNINHRFTPMKVGNYTFSKKLKNFGVVASGLRTRNPWLIL